MRENSHDGDRWRGRRAAARRRSIDEGGFEVTVLADAAQTDGAFSLIETAENEAGGGPPEELDAIAERCAMEVVGPVPPGYL